MSRPPQQVLIRPVITEKTSALQYEGTDASVPEELRARVEARGKYTFEVAPDATKVEIRKAVEALFDVRVKSVRTMNMPGKKRRMGRSLGRRPHWKKAVVELAEGELIEAIGGI
jgi:large subunit ribosomal protein L23